MLRLINNIHIDLQLAFMCLSVDFIAILGNSPVPAERSAVRQR